MKKDDLELYNGKEKMPPNRPVRGHFLTILLIG